MSYARQSVDFSEGIDRQHTENALIAAQIGYTIPDSKEFRFNDNNVSGTTKRRPGLDRMIDTIVEGRTTACALFVRERERLGRWNNPMRHNYYAVLCADHGVPIIESTNVDLTDWDSDLTDRVEMRMLNDCMANIRTRRDRIKIITKTNEGTRARIKLGFYALKRPFYGTERWLVDERTRRRIKRLKPGEAESRAGARIALRWATDGTLKVVRDIFAWLRAGRSLGWIARQLTTRGTPPPGARYGISAPDQRWHKEVVRKIAQNPIYYGDLLYGRSSPRYRGQSPVLAADALTTQFGMILYPNFIADPPISRTNWEVVQSQFDQNRAVAHTRKSTKRLYPLVGALACAACHRRFHGYRSAANKQGVHRRYYAHDGRSSGESRHCEWRGRYVAALPLEADAERLLRVLLVPGTFVRLVRDALGDLAAGRQRAQDTSALKNAVARAKRLSQELGTANAAILRTSKQAAIADLEARRDAIATKLETEEARCAALRGQPDRIAHVTAALPKTATALKAMHVSLRDATPATLSQLLRELIPSAVMDLERNEVVFRVRVTPGERALSGT